MQALRIDPSLLPPTPTHTVGSLTPTSPIPPRSITSKRKSNLYATCRTVLNGLNAIPGFQVYISSTRENDHDDKVRQSNMPIQFYHFWQICRRGHALCYLFNLVRPEAAIDLNERHAKKAVYRFLTSCKDYLRLSDDDLFTVSELYQEDANGFANVVHTVHLLLCLLRDRGVLPYYNHQPTFDSPSATRSIRDKVILELLETERKYVYDLETMQNYAQLLRSEAAIAISRDTLHHIFCNLDALVDFQLRFLMQTEEACHKDNNSGERLGQVLVQLERGFAVYEPYCANLPHAMDLVTRWTPELQKAASLPVYELPSLLIKPVQRVCKYPLLLQQLLKSTEPDTAAYRELNAALEALQRVATKVNETRRVHENRQLVEELKHRVTDWKGITNIEQQCGQLLLHERATVHHKNDVVKDLCVYLFEKMIVVGKDQPPKKVANGNGTGKRKKDTECCPLNVLGLINIANIAQVDNTSEPGQQISLRIFFSTSKDIPPQTFDLESFTIEYRHEEQLTQWKSTLNKLMQKADNRKRRLSRLVIRSGDPEDNKDSNLSPTFVSYASRNKLPMSYTGYYDQLANDLWDQESTRTAFSSPPLSGSTFDEQPLSPTPINRGRSKSSPNIACPSTVKIKLHHQGSIYAIHAPRDVQYADLKALILRKIGWLEIKLIKCRDEDGDLITLLGDEDVSITLQTTTDTVHLYLFTS